MCKETAFRKKNADQHIGAIQLDEVALRAETPEIKHERQVAIHDLLEENYFHLQNLSGPYAVLLRLESCGRKLTFHISQQKGEGRTDITLPLSPFRRLIRDYFHICDSYYDAIKHLSPTRIEAIDMARRALHNEGSEKLSEILQARIKMDDTTARRLFTLLCVLHIK